MIGAILYLDTQNKFLYNQIIHKNIAEHAVSAYTSAEMIQRVIIALPQSQYQYIHSPTSVYFDRHKIGLFKKVDFVFYPESSDIINVWHQIGIDYQLDTLVFGKLQCGLMPPWLINEMVHSYFQGASQPLTNVGSDMDNSYHEDLELKVMPFWYLARQASHSTNRINIICGHNFWNVAPNFIRKHNLIVRDFDDLAKIEQVYLDVANGDDLDAALGAINGQ